MPSAIKCAFCEKGGDGLEGIEFAQGTPRQLREKRLLPGAVCFDCLAGLMWCAAYVNAEWFEQAVSAARENRTG